MRQKVADALRALADKVEPKKRYGWKLACKHGLPNFMRCPECDG